MVLYPFLNSSLFALSLSLFIFLASSQNSKARASYHLATPLQLSLTPLSVTPKRFSTADYTGGTSRSHTRYTPQRPTRNTKQNPNSAATRSKVTGTLAAQHTKTGKKTKQERRAGQPNATSLFFCLRAVDFFHSATTPHTLRKYICTREARRCRLKGNSAQRVCT